ncbi:MAG: hypothetical protein PHZ11_05545 [Desulfitobacteriaceae bacterium]|nr:hypothetical protein [Desulfitobacteriaceae bacterium]MDD4402203.1 hypothetical protein [Desulfitobacteriaceae bacterium]
MPKIDPTISIFDWSKTKTTITVLELQKLFKEPDYETFHTLMLKMIAEGKLVAIKASGQNGRLPSLYNKYRIIRPLKDHTDCLEQIRRLEPSLNIAGYLQKPEHYIKHREVLEGLSRYLWYQASLLLQPMSRKERSFSIWGKEKLLDEQLPLIREVLRFNSLTEQFLNYYDTPEPFFEYRHERTVPLALLILENKDTWFTLRKLMQENGKNHLAGRTIDALIYGEGNKITKTGALENYAKEMFGTATTANGIFYYFGDFDPEGIRLFYRTQKANPNLRVRPFIELYHQMLLLAAKRELPLSPDGRQMGVSWQDFGQLLGLSAAESKLEFLQQGRYIPQEILNYQVLAEMLE